jgi:hypothetical protein
MNERIQKIGGITQWRNRLLETPAEQKLEVVSLHGNVCFYRGTKEDG